MTRTRPLTPTGEVHAHFIGIGGTAMGATAVAMREAGFRVSGQDARMYPPMSDVLARSGIPASDGYSAGHLPADADFFVIGNAISRGNPALEEILNRKALYLSLPETIKQYFLRGRHNLVVTGTHGKTTTTSMLAWILEQSGKQPGWLIGGVPIDLPSGANLRPSNYFVIEGDEYDTAFFDKRSKFLHYLPELVIINNIEFDHADIYDSLEQIQQSFRRLVGIVPSSGMVLVNADDPHAVAVTEHSHCEVVGVGFSANAANRISSPGTSESGSRFEMLGQEFHLQLHGDFNMRNAAMAASAAHFYGVPLGQTASILSSFHGIKRRQEVRGCARGITVIDDFGHHPTAIRNTLQGLRHRFPSARLWALFEPRSNTTRRNIFQDTLPTAFHEAHGVFLSRVARLDQIPASERLDPEKVISDLARSGKIAHYAPGAPEIIDALLPLLEFGDVIVVFSNGGFDNIHEQLLARLRQRFRNEKV